MPSSQITFNLDDVVSLNDLIRFEDDSEMNVYTQILDKCVASFDCQPKVSARARLLGVLLATNMNSATSVISV